MTALLFGPCCCWPAVNKSFWTTPSMASNTPVGQSPAPAVVPPGASEKDIPRRGSPNRPIFAGLAKSRTGMVVITPAFLKRVDNRGVSDKELSELLARDVLIPVVRGTTYEDLRKVSPLLGSRNGLDT